MTRNASQHYLQQQLITASPAQLVAMLYDRAIICLRETIRAIDNNQIEARWKANNKAVEVITHLWMTLDMERGGKIAENLDQLYRFALDHLTKVDMQNDAQAARNVIELLEPLHDAWRQMAERGASNQPTAAASAVGAAVTDAAVAESMSRIRLSA